MRPTSKTPHTRRPTLRRSVQAVVSVVVAATLMVPLAPAAVAADGGSSDVGVCHLTDAGHYTYERTSRTEAAAHDGHQGDLVGGEVTAPDCPGAAITPEPVRIERSAATGRAMRWPGLRSFHQRQFTAMVWRFVR